MRAFAAYVMRGRLQALLTAAGCALISLILLPFTYFSGAVIGLSTLRYGAREGLLVVAGAGIVLTAVLMIVMGSHMFGLAYILMFWLPMWLMALILRRTVSLAMVLVAAGLLGMLAVASVHFAIGDTLAWWGSIMEDNIKPLLKDAGIGVESQEGRRAYEMLGRIMTGTIAAVMLLNIMISLLIARWWQAMLYNPGGFRQEFHRLRLGKTAAIAAILVSVLAAAGSGKVAALAMDLMPLLTALYLIPGFALVHGVVAAGKGHVMWLVLLYGLFVIAMPQMIVLLAVTAFTDSWVDYRQRLTRYFEKQS